MRSAATLCLYLVVALAAGSCGREPGTGPGPMDPIELAPGVLGRIEVPDSPGPHPGVVLLHGAVGWRPELVQLASVLADSGLTALVIDYYAEAPRTPTGSAAKLEAWPAYEASIRRAVEYLRGVPSVSGRPVGLVGFSRGAFLAVSVGASTPGVGAVVDFYGGGGGGGAPLEDEVRGLPPLLILHGDADSVVPVRFAYELRDAAEASGGEVELHVYADADHAFNLPYTVNYLPTAAADAHGRTIRFLREHL
jgi:carboxymethylenebutenolidase